MWQGDGDQPYPADDTCPVCGMPYDERSMCPNPNCSGPTDEETPGSDSPVLVALCGLPGVGKSTVVKKLNDRIGGEVLRTDRIRKRLWDEPEYTKEETKTTYKRMFERAAAVIKDGRNVILDGTFRRRRLRRDAREVASEHGADFFIIKVKCSPDTVKERIENRKGISDADFSTYKELKESFEPITDEEVEVIDNSGRIADTVRQVAFVTPPDNPMDTRG